MASTASLRLLERRLRLLAVLTVFFGVVVTAGLCLRTPATVTTLDPFVDAPLKDMVILVDPGHGGYDGGARAQDSGVWEKEINLAVALQPSPPGELPSRLPGGRILPCATKPPLPARKSARTWSAGWPWGKKSARTWCSPSI